MSIGTRYPYLSRGSDVEIYKNREGLAREILDPYVILEDPNNQTTVAWADKQISIFNKYINERKSGITEDEREFMEAKLKELRYQEQRSAPQLRDGWYYFWYSEGASNQPVYVRARSPSGDSMEEFCNPNKLCPDGKISIGSNMWSENDRIWAYATNTCGSDWQKIQFKTANGEQLEDVLEWVKFSGVVWTKDNNGVFYSSMDKPISEAGGMSESAGQEYDKNQNHKVLYHKLGTQQRDDIVVYQDKDQPSHMFGAQVSEIGDLLFIFERAGCGTVNNVYVSRTTEALAPGETNWLHIHTDWECEYEYIYDFECPGNDRCYLFLTNYQASKKKVVYLMESDILAGRNIETTSKPLVDEKADVIEDVYVANKRYLLVEYLKDACARLVVYALETQNAGVKFRSERVVKLPSVGSITGLKTHKTHNICFMTFESFADAGSTWSFDPSEPAMELTKIFATESVNPTDYIVDQVFFPSKDGTKVPMFIVKHKSTVTPAPTLLYAYGGFNISLVPTYSWSRIVLLRDMRAVVAIANIRGGGEYGDQWNKTAIKENRQNGFDDFHAAAEYLHNNGITEPYQTVIHGASNGGLLVLVCSNQRPNLYGGVIADVPVADMLKFQRFTIGHQWCSEYGNADEGDVDVLVKYSPYHSMSKKDLPPIMVTTASHDDRVVSMHAYKYVANAQYHNPERDIILRVHTNTGHGAGKPKSQVIRETAEKWIFFSICTGARIRELC